MPYATSDSERTPLIGNREATEEELAIASTFSIALDPNASAFHIPQTVEEEEEAEEASKGRSKLEVIVVLSGMWVGTFLAAFDGTIVATILATIGSDFNRSNDIGWLGTSYLLTQCAFQPLYGRFSDIFGRKVATLFASVVFLLGSLACGLSQTFPQLIAARAFAGIGGGGLTTMASIVTSDLVSLEDRGVYQGYGNLVYAAGAALGGPLGGFLGDTIGWKWAFLIQVPLCVIHFLVVSFKVNIPSGPGSMVEKLKKIDVFGAITLVGTVALFLLGMSLGGNEYEWSSPVVWGTLLGSAACLILFVLVERFVARVPVLPLHVIFDRTPLSVCLTSWFMCAHLFLLLWCSFLKLANTSISQFGILFNIPLYFSAVEQTSTSYAGLHLLPNAILASAMSLTAGYIIKGTGKYKTLLLVLCGLGVLGPLMMCFWHRGTTPEAIYWLSMVPGGIGFGGIITTTVVALIASLEPVDQASGIGVSYLFRATGSVLGISLTTTILQNTLKSKLMASIKGEDAAKIIRGIREDVSYIRALTGATKEAAIQAYQESMQLVFITILIAAILAFLAAAPIGVHAIHRK